jgi:two-component system sensor histidine kinase PilS (NtrC family)
MSSLHSALAAPQGGMDNQSFRTTLVTRWLPGVRLVAVSAVLIGALLVQSTTDEILPIGPLARLTAATYLLSLLWLALPWLHVPVKVNGAAQLAGDLLIIAAIVYLTGGLYSPFPFLFLIAVGIAALIFGLRGALTVAFGAFAVYGGLAMAMLQGILPPRGSQSFLVRPTVSSLSFQLFITGAGFALVALLTSYLAHSAQRAEARLGGERLAKERLRALSADVVHSVDSGVLAVDTRGFVVLANPSARRILSLQDDVEERPIDELLPIEGVAWDAVLRRLADSTSTSHRLDGVLRGSGTPLGLTLTPLTSEEGELLGLVIHFRDLTFAREEERRERLRQRMAAVGEMAAAIAHEIRNPLASISGSAQVLSRLPALTESERRLMRIIVEESRRLSGIVESFLGYARSPRAASGPCDVARTLEETLALFANSPEVQDHHTIETAITPHRGLVEADEGQLRQAFFNLARNAIQAMPSGGRMRIEAYPEDGAYVILWHDEGIGMEPHQIEEIFQPFKAFRTGGTGLGLAVVYTVVTEHGGEIHVDSTPGAGTTFRLRLPLEGT